MNFWPPSLIQFPKMFKYVGFEKAIAISVAKVLRINNSHFIIKDINIYLIRIKKNKTY